MRIGELLIMVLIQSLFFVLFPYILLVPMVCPRGYFDTDCGETCHCLHNASCHQNTGYCDETEGVCAPGYETNSADDIFCTLCKTPIHSWNCVVFIFMFVPMH